MEEGLTATSSPLALPQKRRVKETLGVWLFLSDPAVGTQGPSFFPCARLRMPFQPPISLPRAGFPGEYGVTRTPNPPPNHSEFL